MHLFLLTFLTDRDGQADKEMGQVHMEGLQEECCSPEKSFLCGFIYFLFPQLVAGPIIRYNTVERQTLEKAYSGDTVSKRCVRFVQGMSKKLVLAEHGESRMFLAGDAQKERMQELLGLKLSDIDVYKAAHHGRDSRECIEMIEKLKPEYGIVTAGKPEKKTGEAFEAAGSRVICTVPEDVTFISDGRAIHP